MFLAANRANMNAGWPHLGIITSVNPADYTVKVLLQPEEIETGFIPFSTLFYGWVAPPKGGEQCMVLFDRGNNNVPIAALLLYWDNARAPGVSNPGDTGAGEILLKHSSGSYVKLNNAGKIIINGHVEIDVTTPKLVITTTGDVDVTVGGNLTANVAGTTEIESTGNATIKAPIIDLDGNVVISGNLTANNGSISMTDGNFTTSADVVADGVSLHNHVHSEVTTGDDDTGAPV
jgi:phage baseplate assembly protein V